MQSGTKVIYFKSYDGRPAPARIGYVTHLLPASGWVMLASAPGGRPLIHVRRPHVQPFTARLWAACQQWERNAELLERQHAALMGGRVAAELMKIGEW